MTNVSSTWDYYKFRREILHERRYVYSSFVNNFIRNIQETAQKRQSEIKQGHELYRAQIGCNKYIMIDEESGEEVEREEPFDEARMKPFPDKASEGRINPKGIPCFYAATSLNVAISEVRPWVGASVTVSLATTKQDLRIVNCMNDRAIIFPSRDGTQTELESWAWALINLAFSEPISRDRNNTNMLAEYAPTQLLSEIFKEMGFDGIAYNSHYSNNDEGHNIALFDPTKINIRSEPSHNSVYKIRSMHFEYTESFQ